MKLKEYDVWITLAETYEAEDAGEAFELAMVDIENRSGMNIVKHEVLESQS